MLTDAAATGRLDLGEYEDRLARAYSATTYAELDRLTADLPEIANTRRGACKPAPSTTLLGIMSGFERRGRWNVPRKLTMFSLWGGGVVDLRYADFTSPDVEIKAYSIMGGQTILLVSHGGVLDCLYRAATRATAQTPRSWQIGNATVNRLLHSEDGFTLVGWNDASHLEQA